MSDLEDGGNNGIIDIRRDSRLRPVAVKNYCLNKNKAVRTKFKACNTSLGVNIKKSSHGESYTISYDNTVQYETFRVLLIESCSGKTEARVDKLGAHVEDVLHIQGVTIHLYHTKNRILLQGCASVVKAWMDDEFTKLQDAIINAMPMTSTANMTSRVNLHALTSHATADLVVNSITTVYQNTLPVPTSINDIVPAAQNQQDDISVDAHTPNSDIAPTIQDQQVGIDIDNSPLIIIELPADTVVSDNNTLVPPVINTKDSSPNFTPLLALEYHSKGEALMLTSTSPPSSGNAEPPSSMSSTNITCCCQETIKEMGDKFRHSVEEIKTAMETPLRSELELLRKEMQELKQENRSLKTSLLELQKNIDADKVTKAVNINTTSQHQPSTDKYCQRLNGSNITKKTPEHVYPIEVRVSNRYDALQNSDGEAGNSVKLSQQSSQQSRSQINDQPKQQPTHKRPADRQMKHLIIGDSLMKGIFADKMATASAETVDVIPVPGADVDRLTNKISQLKSSTNVKKVTVHVGINNIMNGVTINSSSLMKLKTTIQHKFHQAAIFMSSILPPSYGSHRHLVNKTNISLQKFCRINNIVFINHTPFFTSGLGAPKKNMYRDQIHTSKLGSSILAKNIKYPERTTSQQPTYSQQGEDASSYRTQTQGGSAQNTSTHKQPPIQTATMLNKETYNVEFPPLTVREHLPAARVAGNINGANTPPLMNQAGTINGANTPPPMNQANSDEGTYNRHDTFARPNFHNSWNQELIHLMQFSPASLRQALAMSVHRGMYYMPYMNRDYQ